MSLPQGITSTEKNAPTGWRSAVVVACAFFVLAAAARIVVDRQLYDELHRAVLSHDRVTRLEHQRHLLVWASWIGRLAIAVTLAAWLIPARRIVQAYDCGMFRIEPGTVVSSFLLAFANVPGPYDQVSDVWLASHPSRPPDAIIDRMRVPARIIAWWWLFVGSVVVAVLAFVLKEGYSRHWSVVGLRADQLVLGAQLVSAALLVWIVVGATRFIAQRAEPPSPYGLETYGSLGQ